MNSSLAPTLAIGRVALDAAHRALASCPSQNQQQALPHLVALYSFMQWWENQVSDPLFGSGPIVATIDQLAEFSIPWPDHREILELIGIADLAIPGVRLALYPVDSQEQLWIHLPTLQELIQADLCIGVQLDWQWRWVTFLGYTEVARLTQAPDPRGRPEWFVLAATELQPIQDLPTLIRQWPQPAPDKPPAIAPDLALPAPPRSIEGHDPFLQPWWYPTTSYQKPLAAHLQSWGPGGEEITPEMHPLGLTPWPLCHRECN